MPGSRSWPTTADRGDPATLLGAAMDGGQAETVAQRLITHRGISLLEGAAGTATALHTLGSRPQPEPGWDALLVINGKAPTLYG